MEWNHFQFKKWQHLSWEESNEREDIIQYMMSLVESKAVQGQLAELSITLKEMPEAKKKKKKKK